MSSSTPYSRASMTPRSCSRPTRVAGVCLELLDFAELDGFRGAGFRAGWFHTIFQTIIAERAFVSLVIALVITGNHPEGTGHDTIAAAVADILLHIDRVKLCADNRAGWAGFLAWSVSAVFADIAVHQPAIRIKEGQRRTRRRIME